MALLNCHHAFYELLQHCLVQEKQPFERIEVSRTEAFEMFAENKFKVIFPWSYLFFLFQSCTPSVSFYLPPASSENELAGDK
jgi:hypothetical protein